jgi:hypothetical protein
VAVNALLDRVQDRMQAIMEAQLSVPSYAEDAATRH